MAKTMVNGTDHAPSTSSSPTKYAVIDQVWDRQFGMWTRAPDPPKPFGSAEDAFVAYRRTSASQNNSNAFMHIEVREPALIQFLREALPTESHLYDKPAGLDAQLLYVARDIIRQKLAEKASSGSRLFTTVESLLTIASSEYAEVEEKLQALPPGTITWPLLWMIYRSGQEARVIYETTGEFMATVIESWSYGMSENGRVFILQGHAFQWTGIRMQKIRVTRKIKEFKDIRPVATLPVQPMTEALKTSFRRRAQIYLSHAKQVHCGYTGSFVIKSHAGGVRLNGNGRVIIDVRRFRRSVPVLDVWDDDVNADADELKSVTDDPAWNSNETDHLLPPILHGFSLVHKKWGEFSVDRLEPVTWSPKPFQHLVLPEAYRTVVQSLVEIHSSSKKDMLLSDVVQGKGNGCIIALYGNPGCGKTLTAEAVSEHLQRPLYSVSAGELGTSVSNLENNLKSVLDLATHWNAVLLIDEADVFLERRSATELERNALVSIFLRVLEYFSGILILTTNRLQDFDDAFLSRFSLTLKFPDLGRASRKILWSRFIAMANGSESSFDLDYLAEFPLNGRMIKQTVRTAQALALTQEKALSKEHVDVVLEMNTL